MHVKAKPNKSENKQITKFPLSSSQPCHCAKIHQKAHRKYNLVSQRSGTGIFVGGPEFSHKQPLLSVCVCVYLYIGFAIATFKIQRHTHTHKTIENRLISVCEIYANAFERAIPIYHPTHRDIFFLLHERVLLFTVMLNLKIRENKMILGCCGLGGDVDDDGGSESILMCI